MVRDLEEERTQANRELVDFLKAIGIDGVLDYCTDVCIKHGAKPLNVNEEAVMGGQAAAAQFGWCRNCKAGAHHDCVGGSCRCQGTEEHNDALEPDDNDEELPEEFVWEEPPPKEGKHPLTPEKRRMLKKHPGKFAHIRHYGSKSSAYNIMRNFEKGKYEELDRTQWELREVKDGVHGPGSDLYAAYLGE